MRYVVGAVILAIGAGGCGSGGGATTQAAPPPRLPRALAHAWAQQADAVAEHIAAGCGANVDPTAFRPVLRGMLFTGEDPLFMRSGTTGAGSRIGDAWYPLWWPPSKIAGRYLAPYLFERGEEEELGKSPAGFVDVDIPLAAMTLPG